jgi:hypothetical protein
MDTGVCFPSRRVSERFGRWGSGLYQSCRKGKEDRKMKKENLLDCWLYFFLPCYRARQDEAPAWNVGDKWTFTGDGSIEVMKADQNGYIPFFNCF